MDNKLKYRVVWNLNSFIPDPDIRIGLILSIIAIVSSVLALILILME
jgi:hypothetical protein